MRFLLIFIAASFVIIPIEAQDLTGRWSGEILQNEKTINLDLNVIEKNGLSATITTLNSGSRNFPISIEFEEPVVTFQYRGNEFKGELFKDKIYGELKIGKQKIPLIFSKRNSDTFDLFVAIESSYFTSDYSFKDNTASCTTGWRLINLILLDSLENQVGISGKWFKGAFPYYESNQKNYQSKPYYIFKDIPKLEYYLLKQENEKRMDTLTIEEIEKGHILFVCDKEETELIESNSTPTYLDRMKDGDILSIKYDSYACSTYATIDITKKNETYEVYIAERSGHGMHKTFKRDAIESTQAKILSDFELDCSRQFTCTTNDTNSHYTFTLNGQSKSYYDQCSYFGGYFILKDILFKD